MGRGVACKALRSVTSREIYPLEPANDLAGPVSQGFPLIAERLRTQAAPAKLS